MEAQELHDALLDGMTYDSEFRVVPLPVLSRNSVPLHLLRTRVRSKFDFHRGTTSYMTMVLGW